MKYLTTLILCIVAVTGSKSEKISSISTHDFLQDAENKIINGGYVLPGQLPWQVAINITNVLGKISLCGGALIDERWVLTAATCTQHAQEYSISMGSIYRGQAVEEGLVIMKTNTSIVHQNFSTITRNNNIALLKLNESVVFTDKIKKIQLANASDYLGAGVPVLVSGWGLTSNSPRTVGGRSAAYGQFPWQAAVYTYGEDDTQIMFCGGALIEEQWVLTAAQCTKNARLYVIYLGFTDLSQPVTSRIMATSRDALVHESYNETTLSNDIALLRLEEPVAFTTTVKKITIADATDYIGSEIEVTVSGWGKKPDNGNSLHDLLTYVNIPTISNKDCQSVYGNEVVTIDTLCTQGSLENNVCRGDNGGPLILTDSRNTVVHAGIISHIADDNCSSILPSRYVRTAQYHEWIKDRTDTSGSHTIYNINALLFILLLVKQFTC